MSLGEFPWTDGRDEGYEVLEFSADDAAPAGEVEDCAGEDPDGDG